jgi:hypothetical protein
MHVNVESLIKYLLILCFTDAAFTDYGIRHFMIEEANPFIKELYNWNIFIFYSYKVLLPMLLLAIYPKVTNSIFVNAAVILCFIFYMLVNIYHLSWLIYVYFV